ncbi:hypothetical protein T07_3615 [Trichinella nelsoni]|uniref:Uncharacterized protein n=1 Tax=Trichinella nelsoni TaxID=6336 RepID=A0A0V0S2U8_9BILA|nr:hypothetical protein T07_3615 [Trichinella nelsoni]
MALLYNCLYKQFFFIYFLELKYSFFCLVKLYRHNKRQIDDRQLNAHVAAVFTVKRVAQMTWENLCKLMIHHNEKLYFSTESQRHVHRTQRTV